MSKLRDDAIAQIDTLWDYYQEERALADDLADTLGSLLDLIDWEHPTADAVLARYREARQR